MDTLAQPTTPATAADTIIENWQSEHTALFGNVPILLRHRLHQNPLFSEAYLADVIDRYNRDNHRYLLSHMGPLGSPRQAWKEYRIGDMPGGKLIERIRHERLWISLHDINKADPNYQRLLDSIFDEIHALVPELPRTFQRTCAVLISSPGAQVYYHFDISGQTLWQIQGTKKVLIYPATEPFLMQERLDMVTAFRESFHDEATQVYRPWMDEYAADFRHNGDLTLYPGEMVYWPLNAPHRIANDDQLSISFTTEFFTRAIKAHQRASTANGILRSFGWKPRRTESGPGYYAKLGLTAVAKKSGYLDKRQEKPVEPITLAEAQHAK
jgi:hypothetical protein